MTDARERLIEGLELAKSRAEKADQTANDLYEFADSYPGGHEDELQQSVLNDLGLIDMLAKGVMDELTKALEIVRKEL